MTAPANSPDDATDSAPTVASADNYMISVQIAPPFEAMLDADRLHRLACYVLQAEGRQAALEAGITVTDDAEIHALNRQYLGHDYPTDVLSFGADSPADASAGVAAGPSFVAPPEWPAYLGDVIISYETAAAQAADYGHSPPAEVDVLLIHGLLHLLGYDDHDPADRDAMHARQDALLAAFENET